MNTCKNVVDWPIGVANRQFAGSFIKQVVMDKPRALFKAEYPGQVFRCGGLFAVSIVPAASIVLEGDAPVRYAIVHLGIVDQRHLTRQLEGLAEQAQDREPGSFGLAVSCENSSVGEIVAAAEANGTGGCGCGHAGGLNARVELLLGVGEEVVRSEPIRARIRPAQTLYPSSRPSHRLAKAFYLFDCHSEWQGIPGTGHWTYCRGPCTAAEVCICDNYPSKRANCDGWDFCHCS